MIFLDNKIHGNTKFDPAKYITRYTSNPSQMANWFTEIKM